MNHLTARPTCFPLSLLPRKYLIVRPTPIYLQGYIFFTYLFMKSSLRILPCFFILYKKVPEYISLSIYLSPEQSNYLSFYSIYLSIHLAIHPSISTFFQIIIPLFPFIYPPIFLPIHPFIPINLTIRTVWQFLELVLRDVQAGQRPQLRHLFGQTGQRVVVQP